MSLVYTVAMAKKTIGEVFRKARRELDLTQAELAEKAGIHPNTYAKVERDDQDPSLGTAKKVSKVLKLDLNKLPD